MRGVRPLCGQRKLAPWHALCFWGTCLGTGGLLWGEGEEGEARQGSWTAVRAVPSGHLLCRNGVGVAGVRTRRSISCQSLLEAEEGEGHPQSCGYSTLQSGPVHLL